MMIPAHPCAGRSLYRKVSFGGMEFDFADTGGLEDGADRPCKAPRGDAKPVTPVCACETVCRRTQRMRSIT